MSDDPDKDKGRRPRSPGFADVSPPRVNPWNEVTPGRDGHESTSPEAEIYDADRETADMSTPKQAVVIDHEDEGADGPVAAPLDSPVETEEERFSAALRGDERKRPPRARTVSELQRIGYGAAQFNAPVAIERRIGAQDRALVPRRPSGTASSSTRAAAAAAAKATQGRRYPKMRALLKNPDGVPHGSEVAPRGRSAAPPVPGTFFPAPKKERDPPQGSATPADLDDMLAAMAEGLLIGDDGSGGTEVRVTLRDEFFAGTELRITAGGGKVRAVLIPPDRSTYLELNGNVDELRMRLEARGLKVEELRVAEP